VKRKHRQLVASTNGRLGDVVDPDPTDVASAPARRPLERVTWIDWALIGLAVVSLLLVIAEQVAPSYVRGDPETLRWFIVADVAICGVFAIEFLVRMRAQPDKWAYAKSRWYDILGMIPVSHPLFRGFRLIRILRIVVITSRFVRATNRTFGEMLFESTIRRFRNLLVDVIGGAVVVRGIGLIEPWLVHARFAERIGDAVDQKRDDIHRMVQDRMRTLPGGRLLALPPMRNAVVAAETAAVQTIIDVLRSDELNQVVQQSTRNALDEIRSRIDDSERHTLRPTGDAGARDSDAAAA
jgi:hypothetical protein